MERLTSLSTQVCEVARQAGEKIMRFYEGGASVTLKKDASP
jgi:3'-phosphoadenosine 5'-phosphosulfate (PAPS) 3'-phosphatase